MPCAGGIVTRPSGGVAARADGTVVRWYEALLLMLTFHAFGPALGQPDLSPFCVKLETYLRLAGLEYTAAPFDPRQSPKGKAPYIEHEGTTIGDSTQIIAYLRSAGIARDIDADLTPMQQAAGRILQSMLEEHLYFAVLYLRWQVVDVWNGYRHEVGKIMRRGGVPGPLLPLVLWLARRSTLRALKGQGTGRHTEQEVVTTALTLLEAVEVTLGDQPYLLGERVSTIDATGYAIIAGCMADAVHTPLTPALKGRFTSLRAYCDRMEQTYFPELASG